MGADGFLLGDAGFWEHWWRALSAHVGDPTATPVTSSPLPMDIIVEPSFADRPWLAELEPALLAHVVDNALVTGRVIVPPETFESPGADLIEIATGIGFEVRVLSGLAPCAIYGGTEVVLPEVDDAGRAGHRRITTASVVERLTTLFELHWASAVPWSEYEKGSVGVLHLLELGWSDARVAAALSISGRTLTRRVADAMAAYDARTRFQLGARYARGNGENSPNRDTAS